MGANSAEALIPMMLQLQKKKKKRSKDLQGKEAQELLQNWKLL